MRSTTLLLSTATAVGAIIGGGGGLLNSIVFVAATTIDAVEDVSANYMSSSSPPDELTNANVPTPVMFDADYDFDEEDDEDYDESEDDEEEYEDEILNYEIKIKQAMINYQTKSHQLLYSSLQHGLNSGSTATAAAADVGTNGETKITSLATDFNYGDNVDEELWQVEFGLLALEQERQRLQKLKRKKQMMMKNIPSFKNSPRDDDDDDDEDDDESNNDEDEQEWEEIPRDPAKQSEQEKRNFLNSDPEFKAWYENITDIEYREDTYYDVKKEWDTKNSLNPNDWASFRYWQLHAYFGCARAFALGRPLYTQEMWDELRQEWINFRAIDKQIKDGPKLPAIINEDGTVLVDDIERTYQFSKATFDPPMEANLTPMKGRGLRALRPIRKGELMFKATNNTVIFTAGHTWRLFLFHLYERYGEETPEPGMTCDVLVWSWVQPLEEDGDFVVVADFDMGSLLNEGREENGFDPPNVRCGKEGDTMCMMEYYATKDIQSGDEILCDYREFAYLDSWGAIGL